MQYRLNGDTNFAPIVVTYCGYLYLSFFLFVHLRKRCGTVQIDAFFCFAFMWKMLPFWWIWLGDWSRWLQLESISFSVFGKEPNAFRLEIYRDFSDNFILTEQFFLLPNISLVLLINTLFSVQF